MRGGGAPKNGGQASQALGRNRGGFSTKIHVSVDGLGNPLRFILTLGMTPVIPPRSNRREPADYDRHLYRERHLTECFINKMKHFRRIFSRFEKLDARYLGFLHFTAALIWLR